MACFLWISFLQVSFLKVLMQSRRADMTCRIDGPVDEPIAITHAT